MQVLLIIALLIAVLAVIFALQNAVTVSIAFLVWKTEGSLALVLLVALAVGALISFLASLPAIIRGAWTTASQKRRIAEIETSLADSTQKLDETRSRLQGSAPAKPVEETNAKPPSA